jgi:hypothetical protein
MDDSLQLHICDIIHICLVGTPAWWIRITIITLKKIVNEHTLNPALRALASSADQAAVNLRGFHRYDLVPGYLDLMQGSNSMVKFLITDRSTAY